MMADGIYHETCGDNTTRPPVLLVPPAAGSTALWDPFRERLARTSRVIAFDHRGTGRSSSTPAIVTTAGLAREALQVLDHLDVSQADVFGLSLGGMTATHLALLAPDRVASLCLASTPARGVELSYNGIRRELALATCFARLPWDVEAALVRHMLSPKFRREHPSEVERIEALVRAQPTSPATLLKRVVAGALHDTRALLDRIDVPTLVLAGENDRLLGDVPQRELAASVHGAAFDVIRDAGHAVTMEQPLRTAERVAEFLRQRVAAR
jgi:pimeloyl-ACP methyl ester carboxylesterase